jgi:hypothetical protein
MVVYGSQSREKFVLAGVSPTPTCEVASSAIGEIGADWDAALLAIGAE